MTHGEPEPGFIDGRRGRLFVLLRRPAAGADVPCVLVAPPFAEEMNKTRPMLTQVAHGLARRGVAMLVADPHGTGDSEGEFRDGDWDTWQDDLLRAAAWAKSRGCRVTALLGVRLGCVLAAQIAARLTEGISHTVFWQPVIDGERYVTQFLRLRVAASMMEDRRETVAGLRARLLAGEPLEVAGYELSGPLVEQIAALQLAPLLNTSLGALRWVEIVRGDTADLPGTTRRFLDSVRPGLASLDVESLPGEGFWSSTEIVRLPALVERTVESLARAA